MCGSESSKDPRFGVKLSEDETPDAMDESLEAEILDKLPEGISEMYLKT